MMERTMAEQKTKQESKQKEGKPKEGKPKEPKQEGAKPKEAKQEGARAQAAKGGTESAAGAVAARLQTLYREKVVGELQKQFSYATTMQVPRISKITLNMGVGEAVADKKNIDAAVADLTRIAGQKPVVTRARKAIANFKIRQGLPIGCMVTLRGSRMYEFLDRLITVAFPRMRDFRGVSARAFDGRGNYSLGFKEQIIFPEVEYDKIDKVRGLNVSITTTAKTDEEAKALLAAFRFPFRN
jgi:large subunit ribosomal protein L5